MTVTETEKMAAQAAEELKAKASGQTPEGASVPIGSETTRPLRTETGKFTVGARIMRTIGYDVAEASESVEFTMTGGTPQERKREYEARQAGVEARVLKRANDLQRIILEQQAAEQEGAPEE